MTARLAALSSAALSFAALSLLASLLVTGAARAQDGPLLIRARKAWISPERTLTNASLLLDGGKVAQVASRAKPEDKAAFAERATSTRDFADGVVTAGFVDVHCLLTTHDDALEMQDSFTPEHRASQAYDPWEHGWKQLTRRGVTSVVLSPADNSVAGGIAVFVKPGEPVRGNADAYLKMSFTKKSLNRERRPTSLMGTADYLRERYESLQGATAASLTPAQRVIAATLGGGRPVGAACDDVREILAALDAFKTYQLTGFLVHAGDAEKCLEDVRAAQLPVVLDPLSFDSSPRALRLPRVLAGAGIAFAFAGESADEDRMPRLQQTLCLAVRDGLAHKDALASVTSVPAQIGGLAERVGTLFEGRDADLLVWSGEPWELRSRLLLVVRDGKVVYEDKK